MSEVVVKKDVLLKSLLENKAKHDALLEIAIHGYWKKAGQQLKIKEKNFYQRLAAYGTECKRVWTKEKKKLKKKEVLPESAPLAAFCPDTCLGLVFPEDHSCDYDRAIEMMKATIFDEVRLSLGEFNNYMINDWSWRSIFNKSIAPYTSTDRMITGCYVPNISGVGADVRIYNTARTEAHSCYLTGVCAL